MGKKSQRKLARSAVGVSTPQTALDSDSQSTGFGQTAEGDASPYEWFTKSTSGANESSPSNPKYHHYDRSLDGNQSHEKNFSDLNGHTRPLNSSWWPAFVIILVLSFGTRMYKIDWPAHVCWDETHFGKMGSWYINGTFFFDVHPPLGKMLIGLAGYVSGYNGSFSFSKPGIQYNDVPYIGMRVFCSSLGSALAPLAYGTVWELTHSVTAAMLSAVLIIFDTGLLTLCQYILLDPPLLFFIMAATYCLVKFLNQSYKPFTMTWWIWLSLTGVCLAGSIGVKFVGLFVILLAGITTVSDLWKILGDLSLSMFTVIKHFIARAICLIALPLGVYLIFYATHFHRLTKSGSGDGFFSSAFQSQLQGNALFNANMPAEVAYGSVVTLKNHRTGGGYLHSHLHLYPENSGARQQQVTTYGHKDDNNKWIIKKYNKPANITEDPELVMNGDLVRLEHVSTRRNLHSHRQPAPITQKHYQVTCYGNEGEGDYNDVFKLEISGVTGLAPLFTVRSTFRLVHTVAGCAVQSHNKQLPKWGYEQMEVTCNPKPKDKKTLWNIEEVVDSRLPNRSFTVYAPSFIDKVLESHAVMAQGNSGLKPKEGEVTSRPWQWPLNFKGQPFSGGDQRVYLLGNPVLWWGNLLIGLLFLVMSAIRAFYYQRYADSLIDPKESDRYFDAGHWLLLGWALHYVPFWTMGRVLYFHHYFPSLLYSFMLTGVTLDYLVMRLSSLASARLSWVVEHVLIGAILSVVVYSFYLFSPLSYGMTGPLADDPGSSLYGLKWLDSWDI